MTASPNKPKKTSERKTSSKHAELLQKRKKWEEKYEKLVKKKPERLPNFVTTSSVSINRLYGPTDIPMTWNYLEDLGHPGEFPFTRGVQQTMYRGRLWTMRQFAGFGGAEETNQRFKFLLANGMTGLSVAFHLPTLYGRESTHPMSLGEVGKLGVAIDTLRDMCQLVCHEGKVVGIGTKDGSVQVKILSHSRKLGTFTRE